ncbi:MAG: hypothetical protein AAFZ49_06985 [Cyanobacteria bacterium J06659_2]
MLDNLPAIQEPWSLQPTHTISLTGDAGLVEQSWSTAIPASEITTLLGVTAQSSGESQAMILAQQFDQDILGDLGAAVRHFIDSGQVWALIIGVILGYLIRGLTTY